MTARKPQPTQERLRELFDYADGRLMRRAKVSGNRVGQIIGCAHHSGYVVAKVDYRQHSVHRLVWIWHNGEIPAELVIDHINGNRADNRIENLQAISPRQNVTRGKTPNRELPMGVSRLKGRFKAAAYSNGVQHYLGLYPTAQAASDVYVSFILKTQL